MHGPVVAPSRKTRESGTAGSPRFHHIRRSRYIIPTIMDTVNPAGEFLRIAEHYRQMSDEEIQVLIPQSDSLTPFAQQALANEVRQRGLKTEVAEAADEKPWSQSQLKLPPSRFKREAPKFRESASDNSTDPDADSESEDDSESPYEEDRELVEVCTVWSLRDALKLQWVLDRAGIPFFMGPEKATGVDAVTSDFTQGISVQVMWIGFRWAKQVMKNYYPEDNPPPVEDEVPKELYVRCPQCRSTEVVFEGRISEPGIVKDDSTQKYKWKCDSCGSEWEDDGVAKEE